MNLDLWRGPFGDAYTRRHPTTSLEVGRRLTLWTEILGYIDTPLETILELGAGTGNNLAALDSLTDARLYGVEPNGAARMRLRELLPTEQVVGGLVQGIPHADASMDLVFTSGVLIHVPPDELPVAIREIVRVSRKWVACIEYFADEPEEKPYRGQRGALFKRDFGEAFHNQYPTLRPWACGFAWRRLTGLDNVTWWLLRKKD